MFLVEKMPKESATSAEESLGYRLLLYIVKVLNFTPSGTFVSSTGFMGFVGFILAARRLNVSTLVSFRFWCFASSAYLC